MYQHRAQPSWIDQFVLRGTGPGQALAPFGQVLAAAELLMVVADERAGLPRAPYDRVRVAGHQLEVLADFAQRLEGDFVQCLRTADALRGKDSDPSARARTLMSSLTGALEATATLGEICQALLEVADTLTVIARPKSRIEVVAAVEGIRGAASSALVTVHSNLGRITDVRIHDRLASRVAPVGQTLAYADAISRRIRESVAPESGSAALDPRMVGV